MSNVVVVVPDDIKYYHVAKEKQTLRLLQHCNVERRDYTEDYVNWFRQFNGSPLPTKDLVQRLDKGLTFICGNEIIGFDCEIFVKKIHVQNEGLNDKLKSKGKIIVVPKTEVMRNLDNAISNCSCACKNEKDIQTYLKTLSTAKINFDDDYIGQITQDKRYNKGASIESNSDEKWLRKNILKKLPKSKANTDKQRQFLNLRNTFKTQQLNREEEQQQKKNSTVKAMLLDFVSMKNRSSIVRKIIELYTYSHNLFVKSSINPKGRKKKKLASKKDLLNNMEKDLDYTILSLQFKINLIQALLYPAEVTILEDYDLLFNNVDLIFNSDTVDEDIIQTFLNESTLDYVEEGASKNGNNNGGDDDEDNSNNGGNNGGNNDQNDEDDSDLDSDLDDYVIGDGGREDVNQLKF